MITECYDEVKRRIAAACERVGRDPNEVTLVAVSKTKPEEDIMDLYRYGVRDFGENYIQELRTKHDDLPKDIRWHMIGHLQRNKVKYIADYVEMIHAVDTPELVATIEKEGTKHNRIIPVLIEVNVAGEESKFGVKPEDCEAFASTFSQYSHVSLQGLMTSAPFVENPEDNRAVFRELKQLMVDINHKNIDNVNMRVLSMGMTNDFEVAVEEGSTMVRVGTAIFGARNYNTSTQ